MSSSRRRAASFVHLGNCFYYVVQPDVLDGRSVAIFSTTSSTTGFYFIFCILFYIYCFYILLPFQRILLQRCKLHTYLLHEIMQLAVVFSTYMRLCKRKVVFIFCTNCTPCTEGAEVAQPCTNLQKVAQALKTRKT